MKFRKITVLVFLGCAAFVLGDAQAPLDDDEFDIDGGIDGSGFMGRSWSASGSTTTTTTTTSTSTAAPKAGGSFSSTTSRDEPEVDGSGSGETSDDDEDDYFDQIYPDEGDYADVYSDYDSLGYSDESERNENRGGSWGSSKSDDVSSETDRKNVGVVHAVHPVDEKKPVLGGHKPKPVGQPAPTPEENNYDDDDYDDNDLVIPPEGTLQEINNVREELEKVEEKQRELEEELEHQREENSIGGMDGLGTKAVDRNTSFFAQPGILAAVVGGAVVGLLCAILLVMLIVYRMRKKDEGSYPVDEPKRSLTGNNYSKNKDYYA